MIYSEWVLSIPCAFLSEVSVAVPSVKCQYKSDHLREWRSARVNLICFSDNFRPTIDFDVRFGWLFSCHLPLAVCVCVCAFRPKHFGQNVKYRLCLHDQDSEETISNLVCFRTNIFFLLFCILYFIFYLLLRSV